MECRKLPSAGPSPLQESACSSPSSTSTWPLLADPVSPRSRVWRMGLRL